MKTTKTVAVRLGLVMVSALIIAGEHNTAVGAGAPTWTQAIVTGTVADLTAFEKNFREVLGYSDLEAHQIGCTIGCNKLGTNAPPQRLVYVFPRELNDILVIFAQAWDVSQRETNSTALKLVYDPNVPPPTCGLPHPQPCQSMPYCADGCGRKVGGCSAC
jgi:hypothetical protein